MARKLASKGAPFKTREVIADCSFAVGAETSNARTVSIQLKDADGKDLAIRGSVDAWMSDVNGESLANAPAGGVAGGTDGAVHELIADRRFTLVSEADGDIDVVITDSNVITHYLTVRLPNGTMKTQAVAFA